MFDQLTKHVDVPARVLMSLIFILSGAGKIAAFEGTQGYMEAFGLPGFLLVPTIIFELGGGLALLVGLKTRHIAGLLAVYSVVTALIFHADFSDQSQMFTFLKNVAMAGGFLMFAKVGASGFSVDQFMAMRKGA